MKMSDEKRGPGRPKKVDVGIDNKPDAKADDKHVVYWTYTATGRRKLVRRKR
jgi:hypothetical protein